MAAANAPPSPIVPFFLFFFYFSFSSSFFGLDFRPGPSFFHFSVRGVCVRSCVRFCLGSHSTLLAKTKKLSSFFPPALFLVVLPCTPVRALLCSSSSFLDSFFLYVLLLILQRRYIKELYDVLHLSLYTLPLSLALYRSRTYRRGDKERANARLAVSVTPARVVLRVVSPLHILCRLV